MRSEGSLSARFTDRYRGLTIAPDQASTETIDLMLKHRSVRSFAPRRRLPDGMLEMLIAAGQSGATSSNMQTTSVVLVEDQERRTRLSEIATQDFVRDASVILCFVVDLSRPTRIGNLIGTELFALPLFSTYVTAATDCAIFAQGVALAAESSGLGTCFIGNLQNDPIAIANLLQLPERSVVVFGLCLGYGVSPITGVRPRLPQSVVVHREVYCSQDEAADIARYDEVFARHESEQGRDRTKWTFRHVDRFASLSYLGDRATQRRTLETLDLPLL